MSLNNNTVIKVSCVVLLGTQLFSVAYLSDRISNVENRPSVEQPNIEELVQSALVKARANEAQQKAQLKLQTLRQNAKLAPEYSDDGLIYGPADAKYSISVFTDIECPYCRKMHGEVKRVVDSSDGAVNWKVIHFPLRRHNPAAAIQAQTLECVKDSYGNRTAWAFLDAMIAETEGNGKGIADLPEFGGDMGLSRSLISNCLISDDNKGKINADYQRGLDAGITGTPAMMITNNETGRSSLVKGLQDSPAIALEIQKLL